jgi:nitrile hydratase subunit beta
MNGIHDMGGLHGFGKVEVEPNEPVFHEPWHARVFGMVQTFGGNIDAGRHSLEQLDPVTYLKNGYYGRWLAALERGLRAAGIVESGDIEARMRNPTGAGRPSSGTRDPWAPSRGRSYLRETGEQPRFALGQPIVTRNHQPSGHTRLPAYVRCRRGVILRVHRPMVFPDDHAHGRGENPQFLYTVRFDGQELWGNGAEPATCVHIDLFESYLEPL